MPTFGQQSVWVAVAAMWCGAAMIGVVMYNRWRARRDVQRRVYAEDDALAARLAAEEDVAQKNFLVRWLFLAGFRSPNAAAMFMSATFVCIVFGIIVVLVAEQSGLTKTAVAAAAGVPGGLGDIARPVLVAGPWIVFVLWAMLPWSIVNSARKRRVAAVEQDLPVTLDLLATMSETGLGFDSALNKVLESQRQDRPLVEELQTFQLEALGGISRVQCFRRLARRLEVQSMTIFVSALVQAEQVGAGFAKVLRTQADDLRNRRREEANMLAQALTVKLIFPLVICFLPGIFVCTLGPIFLQFIKLADSVLQTH
jgi:tight adherence protein C